MATDAADAFDAFDAADTFDCVAEFDCVTDTSTELDGKETFVATKITSRMNTATAQIACRETNRRVLRTDRLRGTDTSAYLFSSLRPRSASSIDKSPLPPIIADDDFLNVLSHTQVMT